jgi:myo-inositol-1(or 4)-monophosphatase
MDPMAPAPLVREADWLGACRRAAEGVRAMLAEHPTTRERAVRAGRGEGGDMSLVIDRGAEDVVFAELDALHEAGARVTAVSEERGEVVCGDPDLRGVVDPIDGSLNAKRDIPHHALSLAVADGPTMADVVFGYVYDFGPGEEWHATRGGGAFLDGARLDTEPRERRTSAGLLEVVGIESADPRWVTAAIDDLERTAHRLRAVGAIAITLCQVAAARFDGMASLKRCRSFDAAAAQLIVREAGGHVAFTAYDDPLAAPLDLLPHSPVIAARTPDALAELRASPRG